VSDRLPAHVLTDIQVVRGELRALGAQYTAARQALVRAEIAYEKAIAGAIIVLTSEYKKSGERLPAEDVRKALAHNAIDDEVWSTYLSTKAQVDSMEKLFKVHQSVLSGLQSELQMMKQELSLGGYEQ
jgi:hypothetical protein